MIALINMGKSVKFQEIITVNKLILIAGIVIIGVVNLANGKDQAFHRMFENSSTDPMEIITAIYSGLFAYSGYEMLNVVMGEVQQSVM